MNLEVVKEMYFYIFVYIFVLNVIDKIIMFLKLGLKLLISWNVNVVCLEVIDMNCKECYRWWFM